MNNIKLLKAQANLALSMVDKRARVGIDNYIAALEAQAAEYAALADRCCACGGQGIIRADGIAINCSVCNPATSGYYVRVNYAKLSGL